MKNYLSALIALLFISCASITGNSVDLDAFAKDFLRGKSLDSRTTVLRLDEQDSKITGIAQTADLKTKFWNQFSKSHPNYSNQIRVVDTTNFAIISNSVSNVRSQGTHSAELSTQYLMGQKVTLLQKDGWWYLVQGPDQYIGWIDGGGLLPKDVVSKQWMDAPKFPLQINETTAYIYGKPNLICCDLVYGNLLGKIAANRYVTPDGTEVLIQDSYFTKPKGDKIDLVLEKARSLMGRPYLWGGTSTKGVDCSGFTRTAYMNAGIMLERDASLQVKEGIPVDKNDITKWKPGDLLFFGTYNPSGSMKVVHVAIHEGDGRIIHSSGRVKEESLNPNHADYNKNRAEELLAVRRMIQ